MSIGDTHTKIPGIITQYKEWTAKLKADVPQLKGIISIDISFRGLSRNDATIPYP